MQQPKTYKVLSAQRHFVFPVSPLAREMEDYCKTHKAARINQYQTPLWCDRYEDCLHCLMNFANNKVLPDGNHFAQV